MRKKPQEFESKWDGEATSHIGKCGIFGVYLEELTVDGAWDSTLEAATAAEIFKVSVIFTKKKKRTSSTGTEPEAHFFFEIPRETLDGAFARGHARESRALSQEREQIVKLADADTSMRGGEQRRRRDGEQREHLVKMNTSGLRGGVQQEVRKKGDGELCEIDESKNMEA